MGGDGSKRQPPGMRWRRSSSAYQTGATICFLQSLLSALYDHMWVKVSGLGPLFMRLLLSHQATRKAHAGSGSGGTSTWRGCEALAGRNALPHGSPYLQHDHNIVCTPLNASASHGEANHHTLLVLAAARRQGRSRRSTRQRKVQAPLHVRVGESRGARGAVSTRKQRPCRPRGCLWTRDSWTQRPSTGRCTQIPGGEAQLPSGAAPPPGRPAPPASSAKHPSTTLNLLPTPPCSYSGMLCKWI